LTLALKTFNLLSSFTGVKFVIEVFIPKYFTLKVLERGKTILAPTVTT